LEVTAVTTKYFNAKGGIVDSATIIGTRVENPRGEHLGRIESLMLDLDEGRILYVVLSFGGFLGVGDKLFPVPVEALMFGTNRDGLLLAFDAQRTQLIVLSLLSTRVLRFGGAAQ